MNELKIFENRQFGQVRAMEIDGEPWFVGKDIAKALGYVNTRQAILTNVDSGDKGVNLIDTPSGKQNATIINESGLYSLILSSKLKIAKQFKNWITKDVIPSIRKTGGYIYTTPEMTNDEIMARAMIIANTKIEELNGKIQELLPKATYCDEVLKSNETLTTTQIAKDYCISAVKLNRILHAENIQFKVCGKWNLYAKYANKGLAINQTFQRLDDYGNIKYYTYLCWTQRGREFIKGIMDKHGIKPHEDL